MNALKGVLSKRNTQQIENGIKVMAPRNKRTYSLRCIQRNIYLNGPVIIKRINDDVLQEVLERVILHTSNQSNGDTKRIASSHSELVNINASTTT